MHCPQTANRLFRTCGNSLKSIELSPSYSFAYERLAWLAIFNGRYDESLEQYNKVIQLDPLSTRIKGSMGSSYYFMGRYKEGIQKMQQFLQLHPGDNFLLSSRRSLMKNVCRFVLSVIAALALAAPADAQVTTGSLNGKVQNARQEGVAGANIIAIHLPSGTTYEATSRDDG